MTALRSGLTGRCSRRAACALRASRQNRERRSRLSGMTLGDQRHESGARLSRRTVVWLVAVLFALHNAEEALAFRVYLPRIAVLLPEPFASLVATLSYQVILMALAAVSILAMLVALAAATWPQSPLALWTLLTLEAVVGLNVIAHVLSALVVFQGYGPGLATALLING